MSAWVSINGLLRHTMTCVSTKSILIAIDILFWTIAAWCSFWYSKHAVEALDVGYLDRVRIEGSRVCQRHERWFNFLGSLVGWWAFWIVLYEFYVRRLAFSPVDAGLMLIGFIGMSGYLPYMIKYKTTLAK